MASKGPKTTARPVTGKPAARAAKSAAPKADAAAASTGADDPTTPDGANASAAAPAPASTMAAASRQAATSEDATSEDNVSAAAEPATAAAAEKTAETPQVAATVAPAVITSIAKEQSIMEHTIETGTAKAQAFFADLNDRTKAAVEKSTKLVEDANEFAKGNLEAIVESGRIAAKGLETLGQETAEYSRKSFDSATATMKSLASIKSPTDFFKLQSEYLRGAFDAYVAETSKQTEAMIKIAGDAAQPISNRFAMAMEKAKASA